MIQIGAEERQRCQVNLEENIGLHDALLVSLLTQAPGQGPAWMSWVQTVPADYLQRYRQELMGSGINANVSLQDLAQVFDLDIRQARADVDALLPTLAAELGCADEDAWLDLVDHLFEVHQVLSRPLRDVLLVAAGALGMSQGATAQPFGLSRETVRLIHQRVGVDSPKVVREKLRAQLQESIMAASLAHPAWTVARLAQHCNTTEAMVRSSLGPRLAVHVIKTVNYTSKVTRADLRDYLRQWAASTPERSVESYRLWALAHGAPGPQTVRKHFGSWAVGLGSAGLEANTFITGHRKDRIPDEVLLAQAVEFLSGQHPRYSFGAFEQVCRNNGWASGVSVRVRFGTWTRIKELAREVMHYAEAGGSGWEFADAVLGANLGSCPVARRGR